VRLPPPKSTPEKSIFERDIVVLVHWAGFAVFSLKLLK